MKGTTLPNKEPSKRGDQVLGALLEHGDSLESDVCNPGVSKNLERLGLLTRGGRPLMLHLTDAGRARAAEYLELLRARLERWGVSLEDIPPLAQAPAAPPGPTEPVVAKAVSEPVPDGDGLELFRKAVEDARASVARYTQEEDTADHTCMSLSVSDPDLPTWRQRSVAAADRLAQARVDLEEALADLEMMSSP